MAEFRRIRVRAALVSGVMLLTEDQIAREAEALRGRLEASGLGLESFEIEELAPPSSAVEIPVYDG